MWVTIYIYIYYSDDKLKTAVKHTNTIGFGLLGESVGMAMAVDACDISPICYAGFACLGLLIGSSIGNLINDSITFILKKYGLNRQTQIHIKHYLS